MAIVNNLLAEGKKFIFEALEFPGLFLFLLTNKIQPLPNNHFQQFMKSLKLFLFVLVFFTACNTSRLPADKSGKIFPPPALSESLQQKQLNGVDFFARGNVPVSWSLEMEFGNIIRFKPLDEAPINSSSVNPEDLPQIKASSYTTKTTNGQMKIIIYREGCNDDITGEKYKNKVLVTVNDKRYSGCGQYLFDAALNGKWIMEKINKRILQPADFAKGLPQIELDLSANRLSGHDGCNSINGDFEVMGSKIKFNEFTSTKMACPGNKIENQFTHLISNQLVDYYFKEDQLYFYLPDDSIVAFKKA